MESQLFIKYKIATNESFKSLGSVVIGEDIYKFRRDSMFTRTKKNSIFRVNILLLILR